MADIRGFYSDRTVLLTGVTGFLGKGIASKILRDLPGVRRLYVLIRSHRQPDGSSVPVDERLEKEFFATSVFDRFRESEPDGYAAIRARTEAVNGDILEPRLGIEAAVYAQLKAEVDLVINSAAAVDFDAALDKSLELNTLGPQRVLEFVHDCRQGTVLVQVSTAYVNGRRSGSIPEAPLPVDRTIAQLMRNEPPSRPFDPEEEVRACRVCCDRIYEQAEGEARQVEFRRQVLDQNGGRPLSETRMAKLVNGRSRRWIETRLVEEGMRRASAYGCNDIYTFTKALGEQMLVKHRGAAPLVIVRPSIIEGSLEDPEPGWISGLKVGDPLVVAYGRGLLHDFPARPDVPIDMIPVDLVVNAVLASATHADRDEVGVFHVATSAENPLLNATMFSYVREYFLSNPLRTRDGGTPALPRLTLPSRRKFNTLIRVKYLIPLAALRWLLERLPRRWAPAHKKRRLNALRTRLKRVLYYTELFSPYTFLDCRFEVSRLRALFDSLSAEERRIFNMDVRRIRWPEYYKEIHLPGLRKHVLKEESEDDPLLQESSATALNSRT